MLINNAGILPEATDADGYGPFDLEMFRKTFETNLFGAVSVVHDFLPLLRESEAGRIVNVSTTMGSLDEQLNPESPYYDLVVPVNAICPGWLQTDLGGPDNRAAAPMTAAEGARIVVEMACLADDGPTGRFVDRDGPVAW